MSESLTSARQFYSALTDRDQLIGLMRDDFVGEVSVGMPLGIGGVYESASAMRNGAWGRIAKNFDVRARPDSFDDLGGGRVLVLGFYVGRSRATGRAFEAAFTHVLTFDEGKLVALKQITDTQRWTDSLEPVPPVTCTIADGVARIRLERSDANNAIDEAWVEGFADAVDCCARAENLRAVVITAAGDVFTVGGDIKLFQGTEPSELPALLRRMTGRYHHALITLARLNAPVVVAVHGAVAGGGLGIVHVADIALASEETKFALGFGALGLSGDGGNSWFLPRLMGTKRAASMYLENRVLVAPEAAELGLVTRVVPADEIVAETEAVVGRLTNGPTRAWAEIRGLLLAAQTSSLSDQYALETDALCRTAATADVVEGVRAFSDRRRPKFMGL